MDTVKIKTNLPDAAGTLTVTADSRLMKNYQAALPVSAQDELYAVHDSQGNPIVFSFSPDDSFYVIYHDPDSPTGWTQTDLSPSLEAHGAARWLAVEQLPHGGIYLAVAVLDPDDQSTDNLLIAAVDVDQITIDASRLASLWVPSANKLPGSTIDKIFISPVGDSDNFNLPSLAVNVSASPFNYVINASADVKTGAITWVWNNFPTPDQSTGMLDYAMGSIDRLGQGVYMLYKGAGDQTLLVFKTFPNELGKTYVRSFNVAPDAQALQTVSGAEATTGLFITGIDGISWLSSENQEKGATPVQIATAQQVSGVPGVLIARQDQVASGTTSVWALTGEDVYFFYSQANDKWSTPVKFISGVLRTAPLRNQQRFANELVYIGTDLEASLKIHYMWQDPKTTLWQQDVIPIHTTSDIHEFSCYTTQLTFEDENGQPAPNMRLEISADSWQPVLVNGSTHIVDADTAVEVATDAQGNVTIINQVTDLSTPHFHLTAPFLDGGVLDIDPTHKVYDVLSGVKSADDIPVLPPVLPPNFNAAHVATAIGNLMQFHPGSMNGGTKALRYRPPGEPRPAPLSVSGVPDGYTFGVSFAGGGFKLHDGAGVRAHLMSDAELSVLGGIDAAAGDILQYVKTAADDVESFVINVEDNVVSFVATIGDETASFIVKNFAEVYKVISWVFDVLKTLFEDLIKWLGHLFDWDEIWTTHKVLAAIMTHGLDYGIKRVDAEIDAWTKALNTKLGKLAQDVKDISPQGDIGTLSPRGCANSSSTQNPAINFNSPVASWPMYQIQHGGITTGILPPLQGGNLFDKFIKDVVMCPVMTAAQDLENDIAALESVFTDKSMTVNDAISLLPALVDTAVDPLKTVIDGLSTFLEDLLAEVRESLGESLLDIPFLSAFYSKVFGKEAESLTAINAVALLVAIPYTYIYKGASGQPPFRGGDTRGLESNNLFEDLFGPANSSEQAVAGTAEITEELKYYYSTIGGGMGAVASWIANNIGMMLTLDNSGGEPRLEEGESAWLTRFELGFTTAKFACTVPVPSDQLPYNQPGYLFKAAAFLVSAASAVVRPFIKDNQVQAGTKAVADGIVLCMNLVADWQGELEPETWMIDICSGVGGAAEGTLVAIDRPALAFLGTWIGVFGGDLVGIAQAVHTVVSGENKVIYLVNVGG